MSVGVWHIQPSEFWAMTMREFWWMFDARKPRKQHVGGMTDAEMDELKDALDEAKKRYSDE